MRTDFFLFLPGVLLLALLASACPKAASNTSVSPLVVQDVGSNSDCSRGLSGDIKTIKSRVNKGRIQEARIYVMAQAHCEKALASSEFLIAAAQVFEELGELNAAWRSLTTALKWSRTEGDTLNAVALDKQLTRFAADYVWLGGGTDESNPPEIRYAGAVMDGATERQLAEVAAGQGVEALDGSYGFWIYPGRYRLGDESISAQPGQRIGEGS